MMGYYMYVHMHVHCAFLSLSLEPIVMAGFLILIGGPKPNPTKRETRGIRHSSTFLCSMGTTFVHVHVQWSVFQVTKLTSQQTERERESWRLTHNCQFAEPASVCIVVLFIFIATDSYNRESCLNILHTCASVSLYIYNTAAPLQISMSSEKSF